MTEADELEEAGVLRPSLEDVRAAQKDHKRFGVAAGILVAIGGFLAALLLGGLVTAAVWVWVGGTLPTWSAPIATLAVGTVVAIFACTSALIGIYQERGEFWRWSLEKSELSEESLSEIDIQD